MADKENRSDAKEEGNTPGRSDADDSVKIPGSTPPAMVHREPNSPMTKAD